MKIETLGTYSPPGKDPMVYLLANQVDSYHQQFEGWQFSLIQLNHPKHPDIIHLKVFAFPPERVNPEWDWTQNIIRTRISESLATVHAFAKEQGFDRPVFMDEPWVTRKPADMHEQLKSLDDKGEVTMILGTQPVVEQEASKTETLVESKKTSWRDKFKQAKEKASNWVNEALPTRREAVRAGLAVVAASLLMDAHSALHGPPKGASYLLHRMGQTLHALQQPRYTPEGIRSREVSRNPDGTTTEKIRYFSSGLHSTAVKDEVVVRQPEFFVDGKDPASPQSVRLGMLD